MLEQVDLVVAKAVVFWVVGGFGMLCHWAKMRKQERTTTNPIQYFLHFNFTATLSACGGLFFALAGYMASGTLATTDWSVLLGMAFTAGYSTDSLLNRDKS